MSVSECGLFFSMSIFLCARLLLLALAACSRDSDCLCGSDCLHGCCLPLPACIYLPSAACVLRPSGWATEDVVKAAFIRQQTAFRSYLEGVKKVNIPLNASDDKAVFAYEEAIKAIRQRSEL